MLALALILATQWASDGRSVLLDDPSESVVLGAPGVLLGERLRVDATLGLVGGVHLAGGLWSDGLIKRTGPGYIAIQGNVAANGTAADVVLYTTVQRTAGYLLTVNNLSAPMLAVSFDGIASVGKELVVGPGTGSGNVSLTCAPAGSCYSVVMGQLPGGGQHPARHGGTTVGNSTRMGAGEYPFQIKDGDHDDLFVNADGSPFFSGPIIDWSQGNGGTLHTGGGMTLDPGPTFAVDVKGVVGIRFPDGGIVDGHVREHLPTSAPDTSTWPIGRSEPWEDDDCGCLRVTVKTTTGVRTVTLPWDAP